MAEKNHFKGAERRQFLRLDYVTPLAYKICKEETIHKLLQGYTSNISEAGLLCNIKEKVNKDDILWLSFDRDTLAICKDLEGRSFIYQNGVIGKVARVEEREDKTYDAGIRFITREEENLTNIYPKIKFIKGEPGQEPQAEEEEEENEGEEEGASEEKPEPEDRGRGQGLSTDEEGPPQM